MATGATLLPGDGRGLTTRLGDLLRFIMAAGSMVAAAGAGARARFMRVLTMVRLSWDSLVDSMWAFGFGFGAGVGWFPLGWGEPYRPWYRAGGGYWNSINVHNTYIRNGNVNNYQHYNYAYARNTRAVTVASHNAFVGGQAINRRAGHISESTLRSARVTGGVNGVSDSRELLRRSRKQSSRNCSVEHGSEPGGHGAHLAGSGCFASSSKDHERRRAGIRACDGDDRLHAPRWNAAANQQSCGRRLAGTLPTAQIDKHRFRPTGRLQP